MKKLFTCFYRLPKEARDKAIKSENEFGWRQQNFKEIIEAARQIPMAIIGGQVQYVFSDGTCELYWLSYDSKKRQENESWLTYCNRTALEVIEQFDKLINETDFDKEAVSSFEFLKHKKEQGIDIDKHKLFVIYFNDSETDIWNK